MRAYSHISPTTNRLLTPPRMALKLRNRFYLIILPRSRIYFKNRPFFMRRMQKTFHIRALTFSRFSIEISRISGGASRFCSNFAPQGRKKRARNLSFSKVVSRCKKCWRKPGSWIFQRWFSTKSQNAVRKKWQLTRYWVIYFSSQAGNLGLVFCVMYIEITWYNFMFWDIRKAKQILTCVNFWFSGFVWFEEYNFSIIVVYYLWLCI